MSIKSKFDVVKYLGSLIFKKEIKKQKGIMKILPGDKLKAEEKAKFAIQKLKERANINTDNLTKSDLEFIAEDIANPFKYGEKTVVKSADILPFRFKRSFAEELADAGKKGDFTRMQGIMKLDPKFKEVMKAFNKSKADEKAYKKMVGPKKLIPDRDVIPYQSPEVQKLSPKEKLARTTLTEDQYKDVLKKGYGIDDVIYSQDFYGDTAEDVLKKITEKEKFPFADGGVAGLLGERVGLYQGGGPHSRGSGRQSSGMSLSGATNVGGTTKGGPHGGGGGTGTPPPKKKTTTVTTGGASPFAYITPKGRRTINTRPKGGSFIKRFIDHDKFTDQIKFLDTDDKYHQLGGLDYMMRFPGVNPNIAKGLATGYQYVTEGARALTDSNKNFSDAMSKAAEEARLNAIGIDAALDPNSALHQQYTGLVDSANLVPHTLKMASGGIARQNFAMGRRAFMKLLGGFGAGIGALKTGAFKLLGKEAAPVAKEVVKDVATTSSPPPYFLNLVNKIKTLGDDTLPTRDKVIAKKYKDYVMEEDFSGNIEITRKGDMDVPGYEEVYMSYRVDEVPIKKGKKKSTKVEEYEEYTARPDQDGKMKDVEEGVPDDVIEDGTMFEDNITDFGKASGGIARMLGE